MRTKNNFFGTITSLLVAFVSTVCFAQDGEVVEFIVVNDPADSFVNLRAEASVNAAVLKKLKNGAVGFCFGKKGSWMDFEYMKDDSLVSGEVYASMATPVSDFIKLKSSGSGNSISFSGENIKVTISKKEFNYSGHTFEYSEKTPPVLMKIDGKRPWGRDGGLPSYTYDEISIAFGSQTIKLPKEAISDLYEPNLHQFTSIYYDKSKDTLYITASNSDGAGGYEVAWVIENKKYRDRTIAIPY
jgi:hypothetical protein